MATYTIELRRVCDIYTRSEVEKWFKSYNIEDYLNNKQIETINKNGLWNKDKLAKKIVDHYFMREIGFETPALFKHYTILTMNELMEEKLPLIYSSSIDYDPLINVDFKETFSRSQHNTQDNIQSSNQNEELSSSFKENSNGNTEGTSNSNSSNNSSSLSVSSDTPQGQINKQEILNGKYASNTTANDSSSNITDSTSTNSSSSNISNSSSSSNNSILSSSNLNIIDNNNENYTKSIKGNSGVSATAQKMIEQYRQNIIAIDKDIISSLNILFMGLY